MSKQDEDLALWVKNEDGTTKIKFFNILLTILGICFFAWLAPILLSVGAVITGITIIVAIIFGIFGLFKK